MLESFLYKCQAATTGALAGAELSDSNTREVWQVISYGAGSIQLQNDPHPHFEKNSGR